MALNSLGGTLIAHDASTRHLQQEWLHSRQQACGAQSNPHLTGFSAFTRCIGWLSLVLIGLAATGHSVSSTTLGGSSTQSFGFALMAIIAGAFTALSAHLSLTHFLMVLSLKFASESGVRRLPLLLLEMLSPKHAKMVTLSLGIGSAALSLACAPGVATPQTDPISEVSHEAPATPWDVFLAEADNDNVNGSAIEKVNKVSMDLHSLPLPTLAWQDTSTSASASRPSPGSTTRTHHHDEPAANTAAIYTVVEGDCVWEIAANSSPQPLTQKQILQRTLEIQKLNPEISDINIIHPGQRILLPLLTSQV